MTIHSVSPDKYRSAKVRRAFGRCLRAHVAAHGDDLAGFAIVSWDMRGGAQSAVLADIGMVAESLVPSFAHDALNRHLAVLIAERTSSSPIDGDAA